MSYICSWPIMVHRSTCRDSCRHRGATWFFWNVQENPALPKPWKKSRSTAAALYDSCNAVLTLSWCVLTVFYSLVLICNGQNTYGKPRLCYGDDTMPLRWCCGLAQLQQDISWQCRNSTVIIRNTVMTSHYCHASSWWRLGIVLTRLTNSTDLEFLSTNCYGTSRFFHSEKLCSTVAKIVNVGRGIYKTLFLHLHQK